MPEAAARFIVGPLRDDERRSRSSAVRGRRRRRSRGSEPRRNAFRMGRGLFWTLIAMTTVLLIRHGTTDDVGKRLAGRPPGRHWNDDGIRQARDLPERLAGVPLRRSTRA